MSPLSEVAPMYIRPSSYSSIEEGIPPPSCQSRGLSFLFSPSLFCVRLVSIPSFGTRVRVESPSTTRLPLSLVRYLHLSNLGTTSQSCSLYPCHSSHLHSENISLPRN